MRKRLLFASRNQGKVLEVATLLRPLGWEVVSVSEVSALADLPEPEETGKTFAENAEIKARYYVPYWDGAILADDSGLEVSALHGFPGVASNRWLVGTDADRCEGILKKLEQAGATLPSARGARFVTQLCWLGEPLVQPEFFVGVVEGILAPAPQGTAGFGYDPLFIPEGYTQTFAELGITVKNTLSHRARALHALLAHLQMA